MFNCSYAIHLKKYFEFLVELMNQIFFAKKHKLKLLFYFIEIFIFSFKNFYYFLDLKMINNDTNNEMLTRLQT